jgi:glutamate-ammonia-ligase adenylyltransferase
MSINNIASLELRDIVLGERVEDSRAASFLRHYGFQNLKLAQKNLRALAGSTAQGELFLRVLPLLLEILRDSPDPDAGLNNLERFAQACYGKMNFYSYLVRNPASLEVLVGLFSSSQAFSETLIRNPEYFYWLTSLRGKEGFRSKDELRRELFPELDTLHTFQRRLDLLRRFKRKEMLLIGYLDLVRSAPLASVAQAISGLAEVEIQASLRIAHQEMGQKYGSSPPEAEDWERMGFAIIALGKLGGEELNYSSDIDIIFVYTPEGLQEGINPSEYYHKLAELVVYILKENTGEGYVFRVDTRLRPEGRFGPLVKSLSAYQNYYQSTGGTWERQALIKARPVAGNIGLGRAFIEGITPFVYQRFLRFSEINEIKRLKRKMEGLVEKRGEAHLEVKSGYGGIRDVEFTVQFLQLLHGGQYPQVRHHNTLRSLELLEGAGCLEPHERKSLEASYIFLRTLEHRLQTMHELKVHKFSPDLLEQRKLALKMGFRDAKGATAMEKFQRELGKHTKKTRRILDNLFHGLFGERGESSAPEVDLILDPEHTNEQMEEMLKRYNFKDLSRAHRNIDLLTRESSPLHDSPRTRAFFASIAPALLSRIAQAPDPDMALNNLERCTASLGAKTIFFQMLAENPQALEVFVDLCAWSQFLTDILINNPGMLDQLIDSLVIGEHKTKEEMTQELATLLKGSPDRFRSLRGYKSQELLRIGLRDILGKADIYTTMEDLSGLAEAILVNAFRICSEEAKWEGSIPSFGILALGKLGGREMDYRSDLDIVFLYKHEKDAKAVVANQLVEVSQRLMKVLGETTEWGILYKVDTRLRPEGRGGILVVSLENFRKYYSREARLWEKQALLKARWVAGEEELGREVAQSITTCLYTGAWRPEMAREIEGMRERLEQSAMGRDIKRGLGGIIDIEFIAQLLQLKYGREYPSTRTTSTIEAFHQLYNHGLLEKGHYMPLVAAYEFLRRVGSRLRIVHDITQDRLPETPEALDKLAKRLGYSPEKGLSPGERLLADNEAHTTLTRKIFREVLLKEGKSSS